MAQDKMVSMKMSKKEAKKQYDPVESDKPQYPWGLNIDLNEKSLKKLGISTSDKKVGDTLAISGKVRITSIRSTEMYDGDDGVDESMSLQITDLLVE